MYPEKEKYLSDDMIHPNEAGVHLLGKAVADSIRACGKVKNKNEQTVQVVANLRKRLFSNRYI